MANVYGGGPTPGCSCFGLILVAVVLFLPRGVLPAVAARLARRRARRRRSSTPTRPASRPRGRRSSSRRGPAPAPSGRRRRCWRSAGAARNFGGLRAVDGVDLTVEAGSITALIGPNGSGKTTLFNLVTGAMPASGGEIWFDGTRIDKLPPWERAHLGLGRTFQVTRLFGA